MTLYSQSLPKELLVQLSRTLLAQQVRDTVQPKPAKELQVQLSRALLAQQCRAAPSALTTLLLVQQYEMLPIQSTTPLQVQRKELPRDQPHDSQKLLLKFIPGS